MPLRLNLEKILELRNTSTHFITEEYEMVYIPLFQACIFNFNDKMQAFHNIDMLDIVPQNFLNLSVSMKRINESEIRAKYSEEVATKFIDINKSIEPMIEENNEKFAIKITYNYYLTKDEHKASCLVKVDKDSNNGIKIVKELKDPNDTHKYSAKNAVKEINKRLKKLDIVKNTSQNNKEEIGKDINDGFLNSFGFNLFCKYYSLKENEKYCYVYKAHSQPSYTYSIQAIDFIVEEIKKDPENIIQTLKEKVKKKEIS